jgi:phage terminase large subunit GpA-like protein
MGRSLSRPVATGIVEPGRWRTERTPYLKEIMDCLSPSSPYQRVVFMKGAQVGLRKVATVGLDM